MNCEQAIEKIRDLFELTCIELFQQMDCTVKRLDDADVDVNAEALPMARIDAGAEDFELMISLRVPYSTLAMTYPVQEDIASLDEAQLEDWVSELSNRVVGKLNQGLIRHGSGLKIGLPNAHFSYCVDEDISDNWETFIFCFDIDSEWFEAAISIELLGSSIVFSESGNDNPSAVGEGEIDFF